MIVAEGVGKYYGARHALKDVSFRIEPGEVVGFLGLNGAGKTTALKILCGLLVPSTGHVRIDGLDGVTEPREVRRRIGFLPDRPPLYAEMTVRAMLTYAGRLHGVPADRIGRRVDAVLELAQLTSVKDDLVEWLSHGFRQRVGIAQAILHEPKLVILDEPISGLDPAQIVAMRGLIRGLKEKHTVLLSSHILGEISQTCDRILMLHEGRVVAQGTEAELAQGGGTRVDVVVRGSLSQVEKANVRAISGLGSIEATDLGGGFARISAAVTLDSAREDLVKMLVEHGFGVRTVTDQSVGLEAVFLKLTKGGEA